MLTLDKALQSAGLFSFQEQQVQNFYYCELKDIADAFEKLLDDDRRIFKVCVNYSSSERQLTEWIIE